MVGRRKIGIQNAKGQAVWLGPVYDLCGQESQCAHKGSLEALLWTELVTCLGAGVWAGQYKCRCIGRSLHVKTDLLLPLF